MTNNVHTDNHAKLNKAVASVLMLKEADVIRGNVSEKKCGDLALIHDYGYTAVFDHGLSEQGYIMIRNHATNKELVISKDYGNKTRLFGCYGIVGDEIKAFNAVFRKIDLVGYLNKPENSAKIPVVKRDKLAQMKSYINVIAKEQERIRDKQELADKLLKQYEAVMADIKEHEDVVAMLTDRKRKLIGG